MNTLNQLDVTNKTVFVREDLNVPLDDNGAITDDSRIREALPTLQYLLQRNARVIVAAHFGRPKGQVVDDLRLTPVAKRLSELLGQSVHYTPDNLKNYPQSIAELKSGEIALLENIRFEAGEEKNDPDFAKKLAQGVDIFVNDAFGAAHRAHASTEGIAHQVPQTAAGLLMQKELEALTPLLNSPKQPFLAIVGGSKVSTKITVLQTLLDTVQHIIIGGGMTYTFQKAMGGSIGNSLVEDEHLDTAKKLMAQAETKGVTLHLASDVIAADDFSDDANVQIVASNAIPDGWEGLDTGPETLKAWKEAIANAQTILWNGPVGVFELTSFSNGTRQIAQQVYAATERGATTVLGGGDTVAAISQFGLPRNAFTHVSTGGGASLEFLEGKTLPGVAALSALPALANA